MKLYTAKKDINTSEAIVADDMLLTVDMPTSAGSKMLEGYMSLFEAETITRLRNAGYDIAGKANVGEFAIDLLGETSYFGAVESNGIIKNAAAEIVLSGEAKAALALDVNGSVRRAAAQSGLCAIKPTYGTVSRYGTIPVACSGECVSVMANDISACIDILEVISGHDDKDGTSLSDDTVKNGREAAAANKKQKVAILDAMYNDVDDAVRAKTESLCDALEKSGVEVCKLVSDVILSSSSVWNILMCAELCNNVSRYDGVKYGYRSENYTNIDELYTNSRTEAFGDLLKSAILFGSETLSTDNYMKVYDKALRMRRLICEAFAEIFTKYDAVIMPACSSMSYSADAVSNDKYISFKENFYTAPASVTGLPAMVVGGVQLVGAAFSEDLLASFASVCEKEGK